MASPYNLNDIPILPPIEPGKAFNPQPEWKKALAAHVDELQAMGGGLAGMLGTAVGSPGLQQYGQEVFNRNMEESTAGWQAPAVPRIEDVKLGEPGGIGRAWDFGVYNAVKGVATAAEALAGGVVGGGIKAGLGTAANVAAKDVLKAGIGEAVGGQVVNKAAKDIAKDHLRTQFGRGMLAGTMGVNAGMESSQAFGSMVQDGVKPEDALGPALGYGAAASAVEWGPEAALAHSAGWIKLFKDRVRQEIVGNKDLAAKATELAQKSLARKALGVGGKVVKGAAIGAGMEGPQEGVQQLLQIAAERIAKDDPVFAALSDEQKSSVWNSIAGGAAAGLLMGGAVGPFTGHPREQGEAKPEPEQVPAAGQKQAPSSAQEQPTPAQPTGLGEKILDTIIPTADARGMGAPSVVPFIEPTTEVPSAKAAAPTTEATQEEAGAPRVPRDFSFEDILKEAEESQRNLDYIGTRIDEIEKEHKEGADVPQDFSYEDIIREAEKSAEHLDGIIEKLPAEEAIPLGQLRQQIAGKAQQYRERLGGQNATTTQEQPGGDQALGVAGTPAPAVAPPQYWTDKPFVASQRKQLGQGGKESGLFYGTHIQGGTVSAELPAQGPGVVWIEDLTGNEGDASGAPLADFAEAHGLVEEGMDVPDMDKAGLEYLKQNGVQVAHFYDSEDPSKVVSVDLRGLSDAQQEPGPTPKGERVHRTRSLPSEVISGSDKIYFIAPGSQSQMWGLYEYDPTMPAGARRQHIRNLSTNREEAERKAAEQNKDLGRIFSLDRATVPIVRGDYGKSDVTIEGLPTGDSFALSRKMRDLARADLNTTTGSATLDRKAPLVAYRAKVVEALRDGIIPVEAAPNWNFGFGGTGNKTELYLPETKRGSIGKLLDAHGIDYGKSRSGGLVVKGSDMGTAYTLAIGFVTKVPWDVINRTAEDNVNAQQEPSPAPIHGNGSAFDRKKVQEASVADHGHWKELKSQGPSVEARPAAQVRQELDAEFGKPFVERALASGLFRIVDGPSRDGRSAEFDPTTGTITIYAGSQPKGTSAAVALHEGSHAGLRAMLGDAMDQFAKEIAGAKTKTAEAARHNAKLGALEWATGQLHIPHQLYDLSGAAQKAEALRVQDEINVRLKKMSHEGRAKFEARQREVGVEELLAYYVEIARANGTEGGLFRRIMNALKAAWVRSDIGRAFGAMGLRPTLSDGLMVALARQATERALKVREGMQELGLGVEGTTRGDVLQSRVWHAGPDKWAPEEGFPRGRPRLDKVGTGEGGQLFGWGWYSAENEKVSGPEGVYTKAAQKWAAERSQKGKNSSTAKVTPASFAIAAKRLLGRGLTPAETRDILVLEDSLNKAGKIQDPSLAPWVKHLEWFKDREPRQFTATTYRLDIPDEDIARMLQWEKPLSGQTPGVQAALEKLVKYDPIEEVAYFKPLSASARDIETGLYGVGNTREDAIENLFGSVSASKLYEALVGKLPKVPGEHPKKKVSEYFRALGIVGNKYLDQGSRSPTNITLSKFPQDASSEDLMDMLEEFTPKEQALIKALDDDSWWGFDYPNQVIGTINKYKGDWDKLQRDWDMSPETRAALDAFKEDQTYNYVIWDQDVLDRVGQRHLDWETGDVLASHRTDVEDHPLWRSPLLDAIQGVKQNKASAGQWLNMLTREEGGKRVGKLPGVKSEEMDDIGFVDWLEAQQGVVDKEMLERFVKEHGVRVEEVTKGDNKVQSWYIAYPDGTTMGSPFSSQEEAQAELDDTFPGRNDLRVQPGRGDRGTMEASPTKFAQYQVPGGQNYRELLVTIPTRENPAIAEFKALDKAMMEKYGTRDPDSFSGADAERYEALRNVAVDASKESKNSKYHSSHWTESNVLVHLRFNERTDADGRRVLFVEEVQSDWHQEGRKQGYKGKELDTSGWTAIDDTPSAPAENQHRYYVLDSEGNRPGREVHYLASSPEEAIILAAQSAKELSERVPNAPMKSTSTWAMLGMKRAIKWAADHGFDRVAWTPGEVQAERYDLSKQIDSVDWNGTGDNLLWSAMKDGRVVLGGNMQEAEESLGKEIAQKLADAKEESGSLRGLDLKVGGEGMRAFYDKMLPNELKKWGAKFKTGVQQERLTGTPDAVDPKNPIATEVAQGKRPVWSLDLTPQMQAEAERGMTLYSRRVNDAMASFGAIRDFQDQFLDWFRGEQPTDLGVRQRTHQWLQDRLAALAGIEKAQKITTDQSIYGMENKVRSKIMDRVEKLHLDMVKPMLAIAAANKWTMKVLNQVAYARTAEEVNQWGRRRTAMIWLNKFKNGMTDKAQQKQLEADIAAVRKATQTPVTLSNGKAVQRVDKMARQMGMYSLLKTWESKDAAAPGSTTIPTEVLVEFHEFDQRPSGMTDADARAELAKWAGNPEMQRLFAIFDDMTKKAAGDLLAHGNIDQDMYDRWMSYEHYATLRRMGYDKGQGKGAGHSPPKASMLREFSPKLAVDVFANTIATMERYVVLQENNDLMSAFAKLIEQKLVPGGYEEFSVTREGKAPYIDRDGFLEEGPTKAVKLAENEALFFRDGVRYIIRAKHDNQEAISVIQAMNNMDSPELGPVLKMFAKGTRFMAQLNTSLSPEFFFTNQIRDFLESNINMGDSEADKLRGQIVKELPKVWNALREVYRGRTTGKGVTEQQGARDVWGNSMIDWIRRYEAAGVPSSWMAYYEKAEDHRKDLDRRIKELSADPSPHKTLHAIASFIEDYNKVAENAIRLATFKKLVESGVSDIKAATIAKELTVNFDRRGNGGVAINSLFMFANAGIQGSARMLRALATNRKVQKIAVGIVVASVLVDLMNGSDDDWDKVPESVKARNLVFLNPTGVGPKFVTLPAPWGYNVVWGIGRRIGEMLRGKPGWTPAGAATATIKDMLHAFNPIEGGTWAQTITPTLLRPLVMIGENKNWTGEMPLRPEPFPGQEKPDSQLYWSTTSATSRWVSENVNELFGGDRVTSSGWPDISPTSLDVWFGSMFGALGKTMRDALELPKMIADPATELEVSRVPVLRKFTTSATSRLDAAMYHDRAAQVMGAAQRLGQYEDGPNRDLAKARALREEERTLLGLAPAVKDAERQLKSLRQRVALAEARGDDGRVGELRAQMRAVRERFNQVWERRVQGN